MCTASLLRIKANCPLMFAPTRIAVDYFFLQEFIMILRMWHGYTAPQNADAYHAMLQETILPGLDRVSGYRGAYVARRHVENEVEFMTLTLWDSWTPPPPSAPVDPAASPRPQPPRLPT